MISVQSSCVVTNNFRFFFAILDDTKWYISIFHPFMTIILIVDYPIMLSKGLQVLTNPKYEFPCCPVDTVGAMH